MGSIQHVFSNAIADGTNTNIVRPSDWNSGHNYTLQDAVSLSGNTAGVLAAISSGTLYLAGGNNVTLSQVGNSVTISGGVGAGGAGTGFTTTTIAGVVVAGTQNSDGLLLAVPGFLTTAQPVGAYLTTARRSTDALGLVTAGTNITWTANSAGVSIDAGGYAGTGFTTTTVAGVVVAGTQNTAGLLIAVPGFLTTAANSTHSHGNPTLALTNLTGTTASASNGFTLSLSGNSTQSVQTQMTGLTAGMSNLGDTYGTSGLISNRLVFVPQGALNMSQSINGQSATLTIAAAPAAVLNIGNTAGDTGAWLGGAVLIGANNITLSVGTVSETFSGVTRTNALISFVGANTDALLSQYDPYQDQIASNSALGQSTLYIAPFDVPSGLSASRVNFFLSVAHTFSGAPANSTAWLAAGYGIYTRMAAANSDRMSLLTSYSLSYISASASSSTRLSVTHYIGLSNATSHSTSQYGVLNASVTSYIANSLAGYRVLALPCNLTMLPGRYWMAFSNQSASQGASLILGHSIMQNLYSNNIAYRPFNANSAGSNASFYNATDGLGIYSAQTAAFPVSIPLTSDSIRGAPVATIPYFNFSGIGTAAGIL